MAIKKMMQMGGKAKPALKGKPMGGAVGAYAELERKSAAGDRQAQADLKLEKSNYKKFGDGPGSGPSGAMPKPKKKMGGPVKKKAMMGSSMTSSPMMKKGGTVKKAGMHKMPDGSMMKNSAMKSGGSMKKCKYGCK